jgi:hypothetical protein
VCGKADCSLNDLAAQRVNIGLIKTPSRASTRPGVRDVREANGVLSLFRLA